MRHTHTLTHKQALGAAVDTIFVAWASDPDSLRRHRPAEYMHLLSAWRHYDEVNGRRLVSAVVVGGGGEVMGLGGGSPSMVYSQSGRHVVQVSI